MAEPAAEPKELSGFGCPKPKGQISGGSIPVMLPLWSIKVPAVGPKQEVAFAERLQWGTCFCSASINTALVWARTKPFG